MMNSTPITIIDCDEVNTTNSSTENSLTKKPNSFSSSNNLRSPNWISKKLKQNLLPLGESPSGIDKVVNWMERKSFEAVLEKDSLKSPSVTKEATFYRYDYKSNDSNALLRNNNGSLTSIFNKCVPLYTSLNSDLNKTEVESDGKSSKYQAFSNTDESNSIERCSNNGDLYFSPSSAEKKKELCNYLKLMNHADKKEVHYSQFRRSTRVKNLEKKEMARKVQKKKKDEKIITHTYEVAEDDKLSIFAESVTLKSFNDLNMIVDTSKYPKLSNKESSETTKSVFNFIMPPTNVLNEFNDFQYWIDPLITKQTKLGKIVPKHDKKNGATIISNNNIEKNSNKREANSKIIEKKSKVKKKFRDKEISDEEKGNVEEFEYLLVKGTNCEDEIEKDDSKSSVDHREESFKCSSKFDERNEDSRAIISESDNEKTNLLQSNTIENNKCDNVLEENDVNIRVDYDVNHFENSRKSVTGIKEQVQTPPCEGFSEEEIKKSHEVLSNFRKIVYELSEPEEETENPVTREIQQEENMESNDEDSCSDTLSISTGSEGSTSSSCSDSLSVIQNGRNKTGTCDNKNINTMLKMISPSEISPRTKETLPFEEKIEICYPLHSFLKRKEAKRTQSLSCLNGWESDNSSNTNNSRKEGCCGTKNKNNDSQHFICYDRESNGQVQCAIYVDFYLLLVQEFAVSLWTQTALGNVLGAQNLWIFNGYTKKLILNKECMQKKSLEMISFTDSCVVYVELWTKEHKSDIRQGPVADVFATVYFWIQKLNKMDKKVLQLENINGFADDVQYVVLKPSLNVVVSWHSIVEDNKVTLVHIYTLASDFQTVSNVRALAKVDHYVSSLHNIEDCEELLMGCGERRITLWNIEHGYIVASIELNEMKLSLCTMWVKCDRGILFTVQQCVDGELRLIAINGRSHSWKRLKSYKPPNGFERIQSVHIDNGVLISFYEEGILCWKAQTGEQIVEEIHNETDIEYFPSGKYLIMLTKKNVFIQHALTHLLAVDD